jgi:hypothetical protein
VSDQSLLNLLDQFRKSELYKKIQSRLDFTPAGIIEISVVYSSEEADQERLEAEAWCSTQCNKKWYRSIDTQLKLARFTFECSADAAKFRLTFGGEVMPISL